MTDPAAGPPPAITHLVRQRAEARAAHEWDRADVLKAEIEAQGWRVVDHGLRTSVVPAAPPDVEVGGERRYGSAASVPSRLDERATAAATVLYVVTDQPRVPPTRLVDAVATSAGVQVVVVADDPASAAESDLAALRSRGEERAEVVLTSARLGYAAALNIGLRRAAGEIVVVADGSAVPEGDAIGALRDTLADPSVAVAGAFGLVSTDPDGIHPGAIERTDTPGVAMAIAGAWLAFRRSDLAAFGPLDERFVTPAWIDVWWSLRLRAGADESAAVRRAVSLGLPLVGAPDWPPDRGRLSRRNGYRVVEAFGWRRDLVVVEPENDAGEPVEG